MEKSLAICVRGEWFFLKGPFRPDRSGGRILLIAQNFTQQNRQPPQVALALSSVLTPLLGPFRAGAEEAQSCH
jgi:hypothetical protein